MFTLLTTQTFDFTTNAFLTRDHEQTDFFYNGRLGVAYIPYSIRDFTPRISFEQDFFRFSDNGTLDFDSQILAAEVKYDFDPDDNTFLNLSYALSRLESPDSRIGEFYKYGLLNVSVTHLLQLGNTGVTLAFTGGGYWRAGEPSASDRVVVYGNAVALYSPIDKVQVTAFVRPELQFYIHDPTEADREDLNLAIGATASWTPVRYFTIAATASYVANLSSVRFHSYEVATPSVVLAAQFAF